MPFVGFSGLTSIGASRRLSTKIIGLVAVLLGQFMLVLDATVVNVALPAMQADLDVGPGELTWITSAYMIAFGGLLLLFGRLGDRVGRRRIFIVGIELFTLASIACGFAPTAWLLIVARFVQGIGAAAASSVILAIIATEFPQPADRAKAMSGYTFVSVSGGSLGLFVGGLLTQAVSWHWIFWINVPFGLLALALVKRYLREEPRPRERAPIDVVGAVLVTAAAMVAIYGVVEAGYTSWTAPAVRTALAIALALAVVFFTVEAMRPNPLLPLRMLRIRSLVVTSVVRGFMAMGLYGAFFLATLDMSHTLGFGPLRVGLAFLPQTLTVGALSLGVTAWLVRRFGPARVLVAGLATAGVGIAVMAGLAIDEPYFPIRAGAHVLLGLGFGMAFMPLLTLAMSDVPAQDAGLGSAIVNLSLQLAAAVDVALLVTASSYRTRALLDAGTAARDATVLGYRFAYAVALVGMLVGLTLAASLVRSSARARSAERLAP
jgi:EmrB/QacA subfamily drug resistance transporter